VLRSPIGDQSRPPPEKRASGRSYELTPSMPPPIPYRRARDGSSRPATQSPRAAFLYPVGPSKVERTRSRRAEVSFQAAALRRWLDGTRGAQTRPTQLVLPILAGRASYSSPQLLSREQPFLARDGILAVFPPQWRIQMCGVSCSCTIRYPTNYRNHGFPHSIEVRVWERTKLGVKSR
jgi:hypothetical protein